MFVTPATRTSQFIQGMMDIGSLVCTRIKPNCNICPLIAVVNCLYKNEVKLTPRTKKINKKINMHLLTIIDNINQDLFRKD